MEPFETETTRYNFIEIVNDFIDQKLEQYKVFETIQYEQLHHCVNESIEVVITEQKLNNGNLSDHIDERVESKKLDKTH